MFTLLSCVPDERWCANLLRTIRWRSNSITCPYCHYENIKKDGRYRAYQKYYCKLCKKWFNDKTGTIFHYSHASLKIWFLVMYLFFVLWPGCSIREASLEVDVPYYMCYRFIRTVMERLTSSSSSSALDNVKLRMMVEADEFYIKAGLKGRPYHKDIMNSGRLPRRRGLKPWKGRGTFDKDQPMVTCIHQRKGATYFDVSTYYQSLIDNICRKVEYGSTVYTDEYLPYNQLNEHGFRHKHVNHSQKDYARGNIHVNNCECRSNLYQLWIRKFMGINKYNLQVYSKAFQFIHNVRRKTHRREERFKQILCYN